MPARYQACTWTPTAPTSRPATRRTSRCAFRRTERPARRMSILSTGGRVVTASDDYVGDVYLEDGRISTIGTSLGLHAARVIDARGKYVLPGAIDPHTHMELPMGPTV